MEYSFKAIYLCAFHRTQEMLLTLAGSARILAQVVVTAGRFIFDIFDILLSKNQNRQISDYPDCNRWPSPSLGSS